MRSSRTGLLGAVLALVVGAAAIGFVQPALAGGIRKVRLGDDVPPPLPPPRELRALTFGYHAAGADLLWAALIVENGIRTAERRPFSAVTRYVDAIIEVDPMHPSLYNFVDSLLIYKPVGAANEGDVRAARAYLERGTLERPYDHELWLHYGQFLAFFAPSVLKDPAEGERWRRDGALAMAHAVDIGADADRTLAVSSLLGKAGESKARIEQLQRAYALTDSADTRHQIDMQLHALGVSASASDAVEAIETEWHTRFPFMSRGAALLLGPHRPAAECAGLASSGKAQCPADWQRASALTPR